MLVGIADPGIPDRRLVIDNAERDTREQPQVREILPKGFIGGMYPTAAGSDETNKTITKYPTTNDPEVLEAM